MSIRIDSFELRWFVLGAMKMRESEKVAFIDRAVTSSAQIYCLRKLKGNQQQQKEKFLLLKTFLVDGALLIIVGSVNIQYWPIRARPDVVAAIGR